MQVRTRAAILDSSCFPRPYAISRPLRVTEVTLDPPGAGELLIGIRAAGLCHSDLSVIEGNRPRPLPMILGHEAAGVVEAVGARITDLAVGDHVVTTFVPSCGLCEPCAAGRPALCEPGAASNQAGTLSEGFRRARRGGAYLNHHMGVSAFAGHAVVSRRSVVRVDRSLPFDQAALFGCAVITGVGAVVNTAQVALGARVAVVGLGGVGLAAVLGALTRQPAQLIAVDLAEAKLEAARAMGATLCLNATDPQCAQAIRDATGGGVDYAFEMAGSARAMALAYSITRRGGMTVTAGLPNPSVGIEVPHAGFVAEERTIKGSYLGSCDPQRDIPRYIEWFRRGLLPIDKLLSRHIALDEINECFDALADASTVRQVVVFDEG